MKRAILIGATLLGSLISFNSFAQRGMSPEQQAAAATENRQAVFKLLSVSMGPLQGMMRGGDYDAEVAMTALERIETLAPMIPELLAATDTSGFDVETRALPGIWSDMAGFQQAAANLEAGAAEARSILQAQGADGIRAAVQAVAPVCGACHDSYRAE